jgi:hypothetical protein
VTTYHNVCKPAESETTRTCMVTRIGLARDSDMLEPSRGAKILRASDNGDPTISLTSTHDATQVTPDVSSTVTLQLQVRIRILHRIRVP